MFGIPDKELKAAAEHADRTLTNVDRTLAQLDAVAVDARMFLRVLTDIAGDLRAVTLLLRERLGP
jgi:hypothetical protein